MRLYKKLGCIFLLLLIGAAALFLWQQRDILKQLALQKVLEEINIADADNTIVQDVLGFNGARHYLFLFLNNTELRPGGGFIGSYAVVKVVKGKVELLLIEGSETLDNAAKNINSTPPQPIVEHLGLKNWYFRDSNWSPDFAVAAGSSLAAYAHQNGLVANKIDGVIGITNTVIEEVLKISGPITVSNIEFSGQDFTNKLENEVEFDYKEKGITFANRKQILAELAPKLVEHVKGSLIVNWSDYLSLLQRMFREKQLVLYATNSTEQNVLLNKNWAGVIKQTDYDYLLWVDANLGALKTDIAIDRSLKYEITKNENEDYMATVTMTYVHNKPIDKFTSTYFNYARVFVPVGSQLVKATGTRVSRSNAQQDAVDQGKEEKKIWFGAYNLVDPETTHQVSFSYLVAPPIVEQIKKENYHLMVQKQIGARGHKLTVEHNFGTTKGPGENNFKWETDLTVDREISY